MTLRIRGNTQYSMREPKWRLLGGKNTDGSLAADQTEQSHNPAIVQTCTYAKYNMIDAGPSYCCVGRVAENRTNTLPLIIAGVANVRCMRNDIKTHKSAVVRWMKQQQPTVNARKSASSDDEGAMIAQPFNFDTHESRSSELRCEGL